MASVLRPSTVLALHCSCLPLFPCQYIHSRKPVVFRSVASCLFLLVMCSSVSNNNNNNNIDIHITCTTDTAQTLTHPTLMYNIFTSTLSIKCTLPVSYARRHQLSHTLPITLSTVGTVLGAPSAYSSTQNTLSDFRCRLLDFFWIFFGLCLDLIAMDSRPPSTSTASSSSSASSPALDSAARRSCTKCSRRMSS